jgi:hypothetical protein
LGNPCSEEDMNILFADTTFTLGNGKKTPFWLATWLNGRAPKDIAPKIFEFSKRMNWMVSQALTNAARIMDINFKGPFSEVHLAQFIDLWILINNVHLHLDIEDSIVWKLKMTHKYRGCIIVLSINKSVEPNEEQKVLTSSFDQGFTINTSKQVFRGIW